MEQDLINTEGWNTSASSSVAIVASFGWSGGAAECRQSFKKIYIQFALFRKTTNKFSDYKIATDYIEATLAYEEYYLRERRTIIKPNESEEVQIL